MIRPLRQQHRLILCTLGLLLPVAFTTGLVARKPVPMTATLPSELTGQANDPGGVLWSKSDIFPASVS